MQNKDMKKKVALLVRDRKHEALRVAVGLTLADDEVNVFVMDDKLVIDDEIEMNLEALSEMGVKIFSNNPENKFEFMSTEDIANALVDYDAVIPY